MKRNQKRAIKLLNYINKKYNDSYDDMKNLIPYEYKIFTIKGEYIKDEKFEEAKIVKIKLKKIVTPQHTISKSVVSSKIRGNWKNHSSDVPWAIYHQGKYYLEDGNHRVNKDLLLGKEFIKCRVVYVKKGY